MSNTGAFRNDVTIVPGSGTGDLAGIAGEKFRHLRLAYSAALLFVIGWAFARLGLSLSK